MNIYELREEADRLCKPQGLTWYEGFILACLAVGFGYAMAFGF